jgi:O-antigen/teichoic acid export membrane protein
MRGAVRRIARDYAAIVAGQAATLALGFIGVILATRALGPQGYGRVALLVAGAQLLYVVGVHWTMPAAIRFGREALVTETTLGAVVGSWVALVALGLAATLVLTAAAPAAAWRFIGLMPGNRGPLVIYLVAVVTARACEQLLQMTGRMPAYAAGRASGKVVFCVLLAGLIFARLPVRVETVILLMALGFIVQALFAVPFLPRVVWSGLSVERHMSRRLLVYSAPLIARSGIGYALDWVDVFCLRFYRTTDEIGIYHVAYQWMIGVAELLAGLSILAFPVLATWRAAGTEDSVRRYAQRRVPQVAVVWCAFLVGLSLAGELVVPFVLGARFLAVSPIFSLLLIAASFQVVMYGYLPLLGSYDLLGRSTLILAPMAVMNLVADIALVPSLGAIGAAAATAATYAVGAVAHLALGNRRLGVSGLAAAVPPCITSVPLFAHAAGAAPALRAVLALIAAGLLWAWAKRRRLFAAADFLASEGPLSRGTISVDRGVQPRNS